jgi:hypothetical protein
LINEFFMIDTKREILERIRIIREIYYLIKGIFIETKEKKGNEEKMIKIKEEIEIKRELEKKEKRKKEEKEEKIKDFVNYIKMIQEVKKYQIEKNKNKKREKKEVPKETKIKKIKIKKNMTIKDLKRKIDKYIKVIHENSIKTLIEEKLEILWNTKITTLEKKELIKLKRKELSTNNFELMVIKKYSGKLEFSKFIKKLKLFLLVQLLFENKSLDHCLLFLNNFDDFFVINEIFVLDYFRGFSKSLFSIYPK